MSSIGDPSGSNKIYVIPSQGKTSGQIRMGFRNKGSIVILAPVNMTEPLKSMDCSNAAESLRRKRTIVKSNVQLFRNPAIEPSENGKQLINYSINQNPSKEMEHQNATSENTGQHTTTVENHTSEVVWLPTASQKGEKTLALENENTEMLHSENESDEDQSSVSGESCNENAPLNSSGDTQHSYYLNKNENKIPQKNYDGKSFIARSNEQDLKWSSEKCNPSDRKRTFNPKDILQQLKVINSTAIPKPGEYISVSKREYCREWLKHQALSGFDQDQKLYNFLASKLKPSTALQSRVYLKNLVSSHSYQLSQLWAQSRKNKDLFYKENSKWLDGSNINLAASKPIDTQATPNIPEKLVHINDFKTNADAFKFLKNLVPPFEADGLIKLIPCTNLTPEQNARSNDFCTRYSADMKFKWLTSNNDEGVFLKKFQWWLKLNIKWPVFLINVLPIPMQTDPETVENEEFNILSNFSEELIMKTILNSKMDTSKCTETGKDISKIIHRLIHHPEDAALIAGVMSDHRECSCHPQLAGKKIPDKDNLKKFKPPSEVQKEVLKMTVERLKDLMPTPKDPLNDDDTTESPIHKKHAAPEEAHQTMLNQILSRLQVTNLPVPNPIPYKKDVNQTEIGSTVNEAIVIDDENDEVETNQATGDKIVECRVFKFKVINPPKTNRQLNQPIVCHNTVISTAEESLHNSNEKMIVDTLLNDDNTIDDDDNFETLTEQTNENNHEELEFGPVLDKLIFIQPINLTNGTIISLSKNREAVVCEVSNCSATVLIPKFIKKSGPNVRVRKSIYKKYQTQPILKEKRK